MPTESTMLVSQNKKHLFFVLWNEHCTLSICLYRHTHTYILHGAPPPPPPEWATWLEPPHSANRLRLRKMTWSSQVTTADKDPEPHGIGQKSLGVGATRVAPGPVTIRLAGAAHHKLSFLSWQNFCRDKTFVVTDKRVCRDKTLKRLATKVCLWVTKKKKKKRNSGSVATNETYKHTQFVVTKDVFCRDTETPVCRDKRCVLSW